MTNAEWDGTGRAQSNSMGLAGFIVSLVGLLATCGLVSPVGLILSLIGLKREPKGFAIAGVVLGIVGSLWIIVAVFVIGIGAIAAAVGIGVAASRGAEAFIDASMIEEAIEKQVAAGGAAPESLDGVQGIEEGWKMDKWGRPYDFTLSADKRSFTLLSAGPDGQPSTDDDVRIEKSID